MKYKNYPARILDYLYDALQNEALNQGRSVNRQIETILKERYNAHAPPVTTPIKSRALPRVRKQKQKAETA